FDAASLVGHVEGTIQLHRRWYEGSAAVDGRIAQHRALVAGKKEGVRSANARELEGAAYGSSELVTLERIHGSMGAEVVCRIEHRVPVVFEQVSMQDAGPALGNDIDHATCVFAVLCIVIAGLDAEFL